METTIAVDTTQNTSGSETPHSRNIRSLEELADLLVGDDHEPFHLGSLEHVALPPLPTDIPSADNGVQLSDTRFLEVILLVTKIMHHWNSGHVAKNYCADQPKNAIEHYCHQLQMAIARPFVTEVSAEDWPGSNHADSNVQYKLELPCSDETSASRPQVINDLTWLSRNVRMEKKTPALVAAEAIFEGVVLIRKKRRAEAISRMLKIISLDSTTEQSLQSALDPDLSLVDLQQKMIAVALDATRSGGGFRQRLADLFQPQKERAPLPHWVRIVHRMQLPNDANLNVALLDGAYRNWQSTTDIRQESD